MTLAVRLIALDADGTLLTSAGTVSARTRAALTAAHDAGCHVVVATGRPLAGALPVVHKLAVGDYVVAGNGATVAEVGSGQVLHQANLPGHVARVAVERARAAVPGVRVVVETDRRSVHEAGFEDVVPLPPIGEEVDDAAPRDDETVHGLVLFVPGAEPRALAATLAPVVPDGVAVAPTGLPGSVELTAPGVHKGSGLAHLCERLGVSAEEVVAFGDNVNDHEMLAWAGRGVAMANADADTRAMADEVTASNDDDGVALVVERLLPGLAVPPA